MWFLTVVLTLALQANAQIGKTYTASFTIYGSGMRCIISKSHSTVSYKHMAAPIATPSAPLAGSIHILATQQRYLKTCSASVQDRVQAPHVRLVSMSQPTGL